MENGKMEMKKKRKNGKEGKRDWAADSGFGFGSVLLVEGLG